jgi:hypothetical protein
MVVHVGCISDHLDEALITFMRFFILDSDIHKGHKVPDNLHAEYLKMILTLWAVIIFMVMAAYRLSETVCLSAVSVSYSAHYCLFKLKFNPQIRLLTVLNSPIAQWW